MIVFDTLTIACAHIVAYISRIHEIEIITIFETLFHDLVFEDATQYQLIAIHGYVVMVIKMI